MLSEAQKQELEELEKLVIAQGGPTVGQIKTSAKPGDVARYQALIALRDGETPVTEKAKPRPPKLQFEQPKVPTVPFSFNQMQHHERRIAELEAKLEAVLAELNKQDD